MVGAAIARTRRQLQHASPARVPGRTDRTLASPSAPLPCPGTRSSSRYRLVADCAVPVNLPPARRVLHLTQCPQQPQTAKDEPRPMITTERRVPVNDAGDPAGPACPDGRMLALRCLGIPQVATRAALSRRRTLMRSLAAFCARIQPRNTAARVAGPVHGRGNRPARTDARCRAPGCGHRARRADPWQPGRIPAGQGRAAGTDRRACPRLTPEQSGNAPAMAGRGKPRGAGRRRGRLRRPRTATALS
jgi:hypothetical protein